jgi:hypothetical protein
MDVVRLDSVTWLWLVPSLASFAVATALGFAARYFANRFTGNSNLWILNLVLAALIGAIKNVTVGLLADFLNLANDATLAYRAFGGTVMGLVLVSGMALSIGARMSHFEAVNTLIGLQSGLVGRKRRLEHTVAEENLKLVRETKEILIPKLRNIENMLSQSDTSQMIIGELQSTIETGIRPLTADFKPPVLATTIASAQERQVKVRKVRFPRRISLTPAINPLRSLVLNSISFGVLLLFLKGFAGLLFAILAVCIEVLLLLIFKRTLSPIKKVTSKALLQVSIIAAFCSAPNFIAIWVALGTDSTPLVPLTMVLVISVGSAIGNAYSSVLDSERSGVLKEIENENRQLAHDIALYEQRIWVFRKSWRLLLHGTVQAALTAALTRLRTDSDDKSLVEAMVRQDLARAEVALQATQVRELDLNRCISEIKSSWRGVCDVKVAASERAARALKRSFELMFGVNEIMREAVSNAVRHGSATEIEILIDRERDEILSFQARNNGQSLQGQVSKGMGSQMMDELTLEWSLANDERSRKTVLRATIPVSL